MTNPSNHDVLVAVLERAVLDAPSLTEARLRRGAAARAMGGPAISDPYDDLARQIGEAAYSVTDAQVESVLNAAGNEKATFEIMAAAAVGAGLLRWKLGTQALEDALHAIK